MKKILFILLCISSSVVFAQSSFGVKAGLNYGDNGEIEFTDVTDAGENVLKEDADSKVGYHLGVFYRFDLGPLFIKPELLYTETKSSYKFGDRDADFEVSKLDLPILVGVKVFGPLHIFAGPSLQYMLGNDFMEDLSIEEMENEFTMGAQFGVGLQLRGLGIDVRYERGLTNNEAEFAQDNLRTYRFDSRPNQFILSLSLDL